MSRSSTTTLTARTKFSRGGARPLATLLALTWAVLTCADAIGASDLVRRRFDIPAQPLATALLRFSEQAAVQLAAPSVLLTGVQTQGVSGEHTVDSALQALLRGTGLTFRAIDEKTIAIRKDDAAVAAGSGVTGGNGHAAGERFDTSQTEGAGAGVSGAISGESGEISETIDLGEVVVTGSHIRGVTPDSSPLTIYGPDEIARSGAATVEQFMRQLPENFAQVDADTALSVAATRNVSRGSSVDLHGLGAGSTLILLNGHRLAPSGEDGSFVDVSLIPLSAVERVEVLTDGASAIYGADAVAGVVNFVLRRDYGGAETSLRYGGSTEGGLGEFVGSQLVGKSWTTGGALLVYEFNEQDGLSSDERDFIPAQDVPVQVLPEQRRQSAFVTAHQAIGERWEVFSDLFYSKRKFEQDNVLLGETEHISGDTEQSGAVLGLTRQLGADWRAELVANYAKQEEGYTAVFQGATNIPRSDTQSALSSALLQTDGSLFRISGGNVRMSLGASIRNEEFDDLRTEGAAIVGTGLEREVNSAYAEAFVPLVGEGNARRAFQRLELSLAARYDDYEAVGSSTNPKFGLLWSPLDGFRLRGTYATAFRVAPLAQLSDTGRTYLLRPFPDPNDTEDGLTNTLLLVSTGNSDLEPEESESYTLGLDIEPPSLPGLDIAITYFDIRYEDRISQPPVSGSVLTLFSQVDRLAPFLDFNPDLVAIQQEIDNGALFTDFFGTGLENAEVLFDRRKQNMATSAVTGVQLSAAYEMSGELGTFTPYISGEYLIDYTFQAASTTPEVDFVNQIFRPMDLRLRGGINWAHGGFASTLAANYSDEVPPTSQLFYNFGYDVINATARGRVISVQFAGRW